MGVKHTSAVNLNENYQLPTRMKAYALAPAIQGHDMHGGNQRSEGTLEE